MEYDKMKEKKAIFNELCAIFGKKLTKGEEEVYIKYVIEAFSLDELTHVISTINTGNYRYFPTSHVFSNILRAYKNEKRKSGISNFNTETCAFCDGEGLMPVVMDRDGVLFIGRSNLYCDCSVGMNGLKNKDYRRYKDVFPNFQVIWEPHKWEKYIWALNEVFLNNPESIQLYRKMGYVEQEPGF